MEFSIYFCVPQCSQFSPTGIIVHNMKKELIGARIKELRRRRRLSQEALAEIVGISPKYMSSIERGKENPTLDTLMRIADAMEVAIVELFVVDHQGKSAKELKAFIAQVMKDGDMDRLTTAARVMKAIFQ